MSPQGIAVGLVNLLVIVGFWYLFFKVVISLVKKRKTSPLSPNRRGHQKADRKGGD